MTHHWPSISPWNIWDLPWHVWVGYARAADALEEQAKESGRG